MSSERGPDSVLAHIAGLAVLVSVVIVFGIPLTDIVGGLFLWRLSVELPAWVALVQFGPVLVVTLIAAVAYVGYRTDRFAGGWVLVAGLLYGIVLRSHDPFPGQGPPVYLSGDPLQILTLWTVALVESFVVALPFALLGYLVALGVRRVRTEDNTGTVHY